MKFEIPEGYNYLAWDSCGDCYVYQDRPYISTGNSFWWSVGKKRNLRAYNKSCPGDWDTTLISREEQDSTKIVFPSASMFPDGYYWFAYDKNGSAYYYSEKPNKSIIDNCWTGGYWLRANAFDLPSHMTPYEDWENSLISKQGKYPKNDNVNHPDHYTWLPGIECQDVVQHFNFNLGNVLKYVWRVANPNAAKYDTVEKRIEDLEKAKKYLEFEIERLIF